MDPALAAAEILNNLRSTVIRRHFQQLQGLLRPQLPDGQAVSNLGFDFTNGVTRTTSENIHVLDFVFMLGDSPPAGQPNHNAASFPLSTDYVLFQVKAKQAGNCIMT